MVSLCHRALDVHLETNTIDHVQEAHHDTLSNEEACHGLTNLGEFAWKLGLVRAYGTIPNVAVHTHKHSLNHHHENDAEGLNEALDTGEDNMETSNSGQKVETQKCAPHTG